MKILEVVKEIRSKEGELHFKRFAIFECSFFAIYIHKIYQADKDPFTHSHPWNFAGIVLNGSYVEYRIIPGTYDPYDKVNPQEDIKTESTKTPGSISIGNRQYFHKIRKVIDPVTTLFFTFGRKKPWYFLTNKGSIKSAEYINNKDKYNPQPKVAAKPASKRRISKELALAIQKEINTLEDNFPEWGSPPANFTEELSNARYLKSITYS